MFRSLRARLWLSYAFLVITALAVVGVVLIVFLLRNPFLYRKIYLRLASAEAVLSSQSQPADSIPEVAKALDVRVVIFARNGRPLQDTGENLAALPLPANPLGIRRTGLQRDTAGQPWFYSLEPLADGNWLLIAAPRPKAAPLLAVLTDELSAPFLEGGVIALLISLVLAFVIAKWIADPLQQIVEAAGTIPAEHIRPVAERGPHEVRALTQAFNAMVARVGESQTAQRDFVANVSHELKTPLTSIQGFAQALMDGTAESADARRQAAQVIYDEAGRMHRMALDLLDLARLDAGNAEILLSPIDIGPLLGTLCDKFQPMATNAGITLRLSMPEKIPVLFGDGDRLAQVFGNLVDNALKFTPRGGSVTIQAAQVVGEVQVTVQDTGKGISAASLPHIFDRFYRADTARAGGDEHGAGLGLAIAQEIVAAHGGRITVRSAEGRGTGFVVHLPVGGTH